MDGKDIINLGFQPGPVMGMALKAVKRAKKALDREQIMVKATETKTGSRSQEEVCMLTRRVCFN